MTAAATPTIAHRIADELSVRERQVSAELDAALDLTIGRPRRTRPYGSSPPARATCSSPRPPARDALRRAGLT